MSISRRSFYLGSLATLLSALSACTTRPISQTLEPEMVAAENPAFEAWRAGFRHRAAARGVHSTLLTGALGRAEYLPDVLRLEGAQTEFVRSLEDNIALATSDERIAQGRKMLKRHQNLFANLENHYGVEAEIICAIWGHESNYGARRGNIPTLSALATLAYGSRRKDFFETQLIAALQILQTGDVTPENMRGSWAGAMGHTQFIPTSFQAYSVDHNGDGRRDIWGDDPTDALASTAAYLARAGWRKGQLWGMEIGSQPNPTGAMPPPNHGAATILRPTGASGPSFQVFHNYQMLRRYNNALPYAIAVGHLSDRLAGGAAFQTPYPPDAQGLTLKDRKNLQRLLTEKGCDTGTQDGVIGPKTTAAIIACETDMGQTPTGIASRTLLESLS